MLASASVGVPLVAAGTDLGKTLAVAGLEAPVVANWALAVLRQTGAFSSVPVVTSIAVLIWCAQA